MYIFYFFACSVATNTSKGRNLDSSMQIVRAILVIVIAVIGVYFVPRFFRE
jgi:hypothetical protein